MALNHKTLKFASLITEFINYIILEVIESLIIKFINYITLWVIGSLITKLINT